MTRMHANEIDVPVALARRLIHAQMPDLAGLALDRVESSGTDHVIYRLGADLAVRFPRIAAAGGQAERDFRFLRPIAPQLALDVPMPLAVGQPDPDYPFVWSVCRWLEGENAFLQPPDDLEDAAGRLAAFIHSLWSAPLPETAPPTGRGGPLAARDGETRGAIAELGDRIDRVAVEAIWQGALSLPAWDAPWRWIHADIHPGNLIVRSGRLAGVIDFGCLTRGDPATDLMIAWSMLDGTSRATFHSLLSIDAATRLRGRAWALSVALVALPYYWDSNPMLATLSRRVIGEVIADAVRNGV